MWETDRVGAGLGRLGKSLEGRGGRGCCFTTLGSLPPVPGSLGAGSRVWLSRRPLTQVLGRKLREGRAPPNPNISLPQTASGARAGEGPPLTDCDGLSPCKPACHRASRQSHRPLIKVTAPGGFLGREPLGPD